MQAAVAVAAAPAQHKLCNNTKIIIYNVKANFLIKFGPKTNGTIFPVSQLDDDGGELLNLYKILARAPILLRLCQRK